MNQQIKDNWVAALVSGEYEQCQGRLRDGGTGFCCLGVLTDLYIKAHPEQPGWHVVLGGDGQFSFATTGEYALLPIEVVLWAEVSDSSPVVEGESLCGLNDNHHNFYQIAQIIKESDL